MAKSLSASDVNHLRRLIAWVACEIGPSPEEMVATMKKIAPVFPDGIPVDGQRRLMKSYKQSVNVPLYVRSAIKALLKLTGESSGNIIDAESLEKSAKQIPAQRHLRLRKAGRDGD